MIDRLGGLNPLSGYNKAQKVRISNNDKQLDSISLSQESRLRSDYLKIEQEVKATPDIREDRVAELKLKINDPNYFNDEKILDELAEKLLYSGLLD